MAYYAAMLTKSAAIAAAHAPMAAARLLDWTQASIFEVRMRTLAAATDPLQLASQLTSRRRCTHSPTAAHARPMLRGVEHAHQRIMKPAWILTSWQLAEPSQQAMPATAPTGRECIAGPHVQSLF